VTWRIPRGRGITTVADQALSSVSNFLVGVVVARLAGPGAFGAFTVAYAAWLVVAGTHRALIVNPMMIGTRHTRDPAVRLERFAAADAILGLMAAVVLALVGGLLRLIGMPSIGWALLALAPWLPLLLLQDLWRWAAFKLAQPGKALLNDAVYTIIQVGLIVAFGLAGDLGATKALAAWGTGASVGVAVGAWQFGVRIRLRGGWGWLRQCWPDGRWLLADFVTTYGASQVWLLLVAGVLGPAALGLVRAAQNLMGPSNVVVLGGSSYGLPTAVEALQEGGWVRLDAVIQRLRAWMVLGIGGYGLLVVVLRDSLIERVYGPEYATIGTLVVLAALQCTCLGVGFGPGIGLTAARRTRDVFLVRLTTATISAIGFLTLSRALGLAAAGWAGLLGSLAYAALMSAVYRWARHRAATSPPIAGSVSAALQDPVEIDPTWGSDVEDAQAAAGAAGHSHPGRPA
jgi:O-antigen/teichoic acid export membrane protein